MLVSTEIEKLERRWQENPRGLTFAPLAEAYRKGGETGKALELLDTGLAQHPGYVPAHIVRGRCHLDAGERSLAELDFLCVVELDPENAIALQCLADLAEGDGRTSDAIRRLEALLAVDRNNEEAQAQLARLQHDSEVPALSSAELRLRNDSETLRPAGAPLQGIEILDIESHLPTAPAEAGGSAPDGPEAAAVLATAGLPRFEMEELSPQPVQELPSQSEEPPPEPVAELPAEPSVEAEPTTGPSVEEGAPVEPVASTDPEPEPVPEEPETEPALEEPELVVTETMAEIFLRQGHRELALAVYTQLLRRDPGNQRMISAVAELGGPPAQPAAAQEEPAAPPPPPRRYDAGSTGGRSVGDFLGGLLSASRPSSSAKVVHPPAFEAQRDTQEPERQAAPSFDEFFAPTAGSRTTAPRASDTGLADSPRSEDAEDLEQFNAWLRGLKG